ncbi:MAG: alpha/beta hydrolase [Corticimicrobacter sp.]|uniref:alpha/beta fold hydrolase n=1 Tax=Corticimicrobacter sp. TaxID=2678536 RepID=UPI0032DB9ECE
MRLSTMLTAIGLSFSLSNAALAQSEVIDAESVGHDRISVVVEGEGPDVILVPGMASSRDVWSGLADRLRQTHRLHLVQVAGFAGAPPVAGGSDGPVVAPVAEAIADYIEQERLDRPVIIGHSLGGEAALMLGARHPGQVGKLMIVDALPFYSLLFDPAATSEAARPGAEVFRAAWLAATDAQAETMQAAALASLVRNEAARPALLAASMRSDRQTVANASHELMTTDLRGEISRIAVPVEVVYAYDTAYGVPVASVDTTFRTAYGEVPEVVFRRIDDSFHFIMLDQPEQFERTVIEFLR